MPIKILMPALSPTMTEGNLAKWLKNEGDQVKPGEVIAEIETDKATMEVEAVDEGIIGKIVIVAGTENVAVNSIIALLLEEGEDIASLDNFKTDLPKQHLEIEVSKVGLDKNNDFTELNESKSHKFLESNRIIASPLARRIAELDGVNLNNIQGTGPYGRIVKSDVISAKSQIKGPISRNPQEYRTVPNNNVRKIIAKKLVESKQTIPHFYLSIECVVDRLLDVRADINHAGEGDKSQRVSVNDFIILAVAKSLKDVPEANGSWDVDGIKYYNNVDISVAVAIDGGLITPVIRNANQKSITELSTEMKILAKKARENKLTPEEFLGGGFSISNLGMYGIKKFSAIINPPQSCILAIGESSKRAVVVDDAIKIATMMDVTLSCDHRVVDGAVGAKFLSAFKKYIEKPVLMLI